ncbi:hypothetical protein ACHQM5_001822 [Ranunculus cassubicifolius]
MTVVEGKPQSSDVKVERRKRGTCFTKWYSYDLYHAGIVTYIHVLCLFTPFYFTWRAFWVACGLYVLCGYGITLSFHRNLTHRSFKLPKYLEYIFAYIGCHAFQADPIWWVSTHRFHHKNTDTVQDPHSPIEGFWFAHLLWLFDNKYIGSKGANFGNVEDLLKQSYYRFLRKTYAYHICLQAIVLYKFGGFPFIVLGMGFRGVWGYHSTWLVNSACHTWGQQAWNTGDLSKNNWLVALCTFGEGWHNNHHTFEYSAQHGIEWWQMDTTWYVIKLLEYCGLATDVKVPSKIQMEKMSFKTE